MFFKSNFKNDFDFFSITTEYFNYANFKFPKGKKYNMTGHTRRLNYLARQC